MTKHYDERKAANERYLAKLDEVRIRLPKGQKSVWQDAAARAGESLNQYIIKAVQNRMDKEKEG